MFLQVFQEDRRGHVADSLCFFPLPIYCIAKGAKSTCTSPFSDSFSGQGDSSYLLEALMQGGHIEGKAREHLEYIVLSLFQANAGSLEGVQHLTRTRTNPQAASACTTISVGTGTYLHTLQCSSSSRLHASYYISHANNYHHVQLFDSCQLYLPDLDTVTHILSISRFSSGSKLLQIPKIADSIKTVNLGWYLVINK